MAEKTAIVTGAGSGVGKAVALQLGQLGFNVALVGRTASKLDDTAEAFAKLASDGAACAVIALDLCDEAAPDAAVQRTLERFGRIDAIANAAGHAPLLPIRSFDAAQWRQTIDANLTAIVLITSAAWPTFKKQRGGVIVNVSSMASIDPFPGLGVYGVAKIGVNMLTRVTATEGKEINLKAVAIAPGAIDTPMLRANFSEKILPKEKTLSPEQVAELICDCITGDRDFENGQTIVFDSP